MQHHTALANHNGRASDVRWVGMFVEWRGQCRNNFQKLCNRFAFANVARNRGRKMCKEILHYLRVRLFHPKIHGGINLLAVRKNNSPKFS